MKRLMLSLTALAAVVATPLASQAAPWQSVNQRQAALEQRIDQGVRSGALTRAESQRLRSDLRALAQLETKYRRSNGLSARERADLDNRFDRLSRQIRVQKNDHDARRH
ncbi:hypothetical protein [Caulobacter sp.]|uniref:hypothetical protein n=1 Tax=Caulobacter sp. TaxID=78 RepID=UPI0031DDF069